MDSAHGHRKQALMAPGGRAAALQISSTRNLPQIVTLGLIVLLYTGSSHPSYGGDMASQTKVASRQTAEEEEAAARAQARQDRLDELDVTDAISLGDMREICSDGGAGVVRAKQLARGNGFPEVHEICRAVIDVAAKRGLSWDLYGGLVVRELGIGWGVESEGTFAAVQNGEPGKMLTAVVQAAGRGETQFTGLTGKVMPLRPELAYDAGYYVGRAQPQNIPALSPAAIEEGAQACYSEPPLDRITLDGHALPATKACLIVGGNAGKRFPVDDAAPEAAPTAPTGSVTRTTTKSAAAGQ